MKTAFIAGLYRNYIYTQVTYRDKSRRKGSDSEQRQSETLKSRYRPVAPAISVGRSIMPALVRRGNAPAWLP